jgi:hypothetical protein
MSELKYLSDRTLAQLRKDISSNIDRYEGTGFRDLADEPGWDVPLGLEFDANRLAQLDLSKPTNISVIDLANSKIVGLALPNLTPSVANEERVWVRLAHVEAFDYCRARWLDGAGHDQVDALVRDHFFAPTQTGIRDDHALSRLWWNFHIARTCDPDDIDGALSLILTTADIRSNFVERIWMTSRKSIAGAVLRAMRTEPWITSAERNFREFMKALNRLGGGVVFEALSAADIDAFVRDCVKVSRAGDAR